MRLNSLLSLVLLFATASAHGAADTKIFLVSDTHAAYKNYGPFLRTLHSRIEDFKGKNPGAGVLIVFNGDVAGTGLYSEWDLGDLEYDMISALALHYPTAVTLGNHEGLDFSYVGGHNDVLLQQLNRYTQSTGNRTLTANLIPAPSATHLFAPSQDFDLNGVSTRVVGVSLKTFFKESGYDINAEPQVFRNVPPSEYLETMQQQTRLAARDGVTRLIFATHDGAAQLHATVARYEDWKRSQPELSEVNATVLAGHMHQLAHYAEGAVRVIEAGSDLNFAEIGMEGGRVTDVTHWTKELQEAVDDEYAVLPVDLQNIVVSAGFTVQAIDEENATMISASSLVEEPGNKDQKVDRRRTAVGRAFATAMQEWAEDEVYAGALGGIQEYISGTVGLYNRLSMGWGDKLDGLFKETGITVGALKTAAHFRGRLGLRLLTGRQLMLLIRSMRDFGQASERPFSTPILSANLLQQGNEFWIRNLDGDLTIIENNDEQLYAVAMDHYTSRNGYQIPGVEEALRDAPTAAHGDRTNLNTEVLIKYIECSEALRPLATKSHTE